MSTPLVILVGGRLTSGKDAFADHLVEQHQFKKLGMSDTLAEALYRLNPIIPLYEVDDWKELGEEPEEDWDTSRRYKYIVDQIGYVRAKRIEEVRRLLQQLGTEVGRELLGQNIWVEAARKKILELTSAGHNVVITGIRFPNELDLEDQLNNLTQYGHQVAASVYVDRPSLPAPVAGHASEGSVTPEEFEYVLGNTGTLEDLYEAADRLLGTIVHDYAV